MLRAVTDEANELTTSRTRKAVDGTRPAGLVTGPSAVGLVGPLVTVGNNDRP